MKDFYEFASNNPYLTFFLALITLSAIVQITESVTGHKSEPAISLEIGDNEDENRSKH